MAKKKVIHIFSYKKKSPSPKPEYIIGILVLISLLLQAVLINLMNFTSTTLTKDYVDNLTEYNRAKELNIKLLEELLFLESYTFVDRQARSEGFVDAKYILLK